MSHPERETFAFFNLKKELIQAVADLGYQKPTQVQLETIPVLLAGHDLIGLAQTGTGKTAAFALPILQAIDCNKNHPQAMIQAPTRELAEQVAQAIKSFAKHLPQIKIATIYGGDSYSRQINELQRGAQIIVGTPGRTIDHLQRGNLKLSKITHFVLDEADEMLRMGFIDDIETIMSHVPSDAQKALFSATMPRQINDIARKYLVKPQEIAIKTRTQHNESITQYYTIVPQHQKMSMLNKFFMSSDLSRAIVFVRTKALAEDVASFLQSSQLRALAIHGDMPQVMRKKSIEKFKSGQATILCATDVAARGLDIDEVDWVINMDMPFDVETYTHRIGRTGRAGNTGNSLSLFTPREQFFLRKLNQKFNNSLAEYTLPSIAELNARRVQQYCAKVEKAMAYISPKKQEQFTAIIEQLQQTSGDDLLKIATALVALQDSASPIMFPEEPKYKQVNDRDTRTKESGKNWKDSRSSGARSGDRPGARSGDRPGARSGDRPGARSADRSAAYTDKKPSKRKESGAPRKLELYKRKDKAQGDDRPMELYKLDVGTAHGARPGNIVGAIANEAGIESRFIDKVQINEQYTTVMLPQGMSKNIIRNLQQAWVCGRQLNIAKA